MATTKEPTRWDEMIGGISHTPSMTMFYLRVTVNGVSSGQEVWVETWRFKNNQALYKNTLEHMVRDIERWLP